MKQNLNLLEKIVLDNIAFKYHLAFAPLIAFGTGIKSSLLYAALFLLSLTITSLMVPVAVKYSPKIYLTTIVEIFILGLISLIYYLGLKKETTWLINFQIYLPILALILIYIFKISMADEIEMKSSSQKIDFKAYYIKLFLNSISVGIGFLIVFLTILLIKIIVSGKFISVLFKDAMIPQNGLFEKVVGSLIALAIGVWGYNLIRSTKK